MVGIAPCLLRLTQCSEFANAYQGAAPLPDPETPVLTKGATGAAIPLIARHMHRFGKETYCRLHDGRPGQQC
jgi:hypothetical protein